MPSIHFTCEVLSPMFLSGADGKTPELRPPSIKGVLRYWWRALNAHLPTDKLRSEETTWFGGAQLISKKSSLILSCRELDMKRGESPLLPHKGGQRPKCFMPESKFEVTFRFWREPSPNYFFNLFILTGVLGGLGKRSRRGMGSWRVLSYRQDGGETQNYTWPSSLREIHDLIQVVSPYANLSSNSIKFHYPNGMQSYPCLYRIDLGKNRADILTHIGKTTHNLLAKHKVDYEDALGRAIKGRFASPIHLSLIAKDKVLLTTLNTIAEKKGTGSILKIQEEFRNCFI